MQKQVLDSNIDNNEESGVVMLFLAIVLLGLIAVCGLAIDGWQLILTARETQLAADAAALSGVAALEPNSDAFASCSAPVPKVNTPSLCFYPRTDSGWRNVKRRTAAILAETKVNGLDVEARNALSSGNFRFDDNSGQITFDDDLGYRRDTGTVGNLSVNVIRGIQCFDTKNVLRWIPLEGVDSLLSPGPKYWCKANAVQVTITISNVKTSFLNAVGVDRTDKVTAQATATRQPPDDSTFSDGSLPNLNICGNDQCSLLGTFDETTEMFVPFPC